MRTAFASGLPIALPTDTVYGLSCPFDHESGIAALYEIKGRPPEKAIPVLLAARSQLKQVALPFQSEVAAALAERFWPGPLTLILPARHDLSAELLAGGDTVAVRVVDHPVFRAVAERFGPLATTSANRSGSPDCRSAQAVNDQLHGRLPLILDGGESPEAQPSAIVKAQGGKVSVLRSGSLAKAVSEFLAAASASG